MGFCQDSCTALVLRAWPDRLVTGSGTAERRKWVMSQDSSRRDYFPHWLVTVHPAHVCACVAGYRKRGQTDTETDHNKERERQREGDRERQRERHRDLVTDRDRNRQTYRDTARDRE